VKNFIFGVLVVIISGGLAYGAYQFGRQSNRKEIPTPVVNQPVSPAVSQSEKTIPTPTLTPTPTITSANDSELIRQALFKKHNWPDDTQITISVKTNDSQYASGSITAQGGGGLFFAAKVNGTWQIVSDGNGVTMCSDLAPYPDFPKTLLPECWDQTTNKTVIR
jgi:hypothetical protein